MDSCPICKGRHANNFEPLDLASKEIIPFLKKTLGLRVNHPLPFRYHGLLESCFAYSQALSYNRVHGARGVFYTQNKFMIMCSQDLADKFGMPVKHERFKPDTYKNVCMFNTEDEANGSHLKMYKDIAYQDIAYQVLGMYGTMLWWSKSDYLDKNPDNLVVFNSNVCIDKGKIWYGDLDITKDSDKLKELAKRLNETVYVLREMDGRFNNEQSPLLNKFVYKVSPDGETEVGQK